MLRVVFTLFVVAAANAEHRAEPGGAPPAGLSPEIAATLNKTGTKVVQSGKTVLEVWLASSPASAPPVSDPGVSLPTIAKGALIGAVSYTADSSDRRGHKIPAGVYTLRYANYPADKNHESAGSQRDFLVLSPAAADRNSGVMADFETLLSQSRAASGTQHPLVLSIWKADSDFPGFYLEAEIHGVLQTKLGPDPICIMLIGKAE